MAISTGAITNNATKFNGGICNLRLQASFYTFINVSVKVSDCVSKMPEDKKMYDMVGSSPHRNKNIVLYLLKVDVFVDFANSIKIA